MIVNTIFLSYEKKSEIQKHKTQKQKQYKTKQTNKTQKKCIAFALI